MGLVRWCAMEERIGMVDHALDYFFVYEKCIRVCTYLNTLFVCAVFRCMCKCIDNRLNRKTTEKIERCCGGR